MTTLMNRILHYRSTVARANGGPDDRPERTAIVGGPDQDVVATFSASHWPLLTALNRKLSLWSQEPLFVSAFGGDLPREWVVEAIDANTPFRLSLRGKDGDLQFLLQEGRMVPGPMSRIVDGRFNYTREPVAGEEDRRTTSVQNHLGPVLRPDLVAQAAEELIVSHLSLLAERGVLSLDSAARQGLLARVPVSVVAPSRRM